MLIILEGSDKTGKSTLAKKLVTEHDFKYRHFSKPKKGEDLYHTYSKALDLARGKDVVFDRFLYGELVYGPLYRGKSQLTDWQVRNLELKLLGLNPLIIYCHDEPAKIIQRFEADGETFAKPALVPRLLKAYERLLTSKKRLVNVTQHQIQSTDDLTQGELLEHLVDFLRTQTPIVKLRDFVGNKVDPELILVGERRNQRQPHYQVPQPFDVGPSSDFLFNSLERAKVPLTDILLGNQDSKDLKELRYLPGAKVVALGEVSHLTLRDLGIPHTHLPHPAHEHRFHRHDSKFASQLKKLYHA